jgi:hypothetical protein
MPELNRRYFVRHVAIVLLFYFGWNYLTQWYLYQHFSDCLLFWILFLAATGLAAFPRAVSVFQEARRSHILIVFVLIVLSLPWSEWLQQKPNVAREDWTRQIFFQVILLYVVLTIFELFPQIRIWLDQTARGLLTFIASHKILFYLPAIVFFFVTSWVSIFFFEKTPIVQDSASHLFQSKIFSQFQLYAPVPPVPEFFSCVGDLLIMKGGKWLSIYTPGYAALLAPFVPIRAEWIVTPLLAALTITIWITYISRWYGKQTASLFGILAVLSPLLIVVSSTIMVHTPELFVVSASVYLCRLETEEPKNWRRFLLGIILAWGMLVRPFSLLVFLAPVLVYSCWNRMKAKDWKFILAVVLGIAAGFALLGLYQWKTLGSPFTTGQLLEFPQGKYGFIKKARGLEQVSNTILSMNNWLNGWYTGSLFFLAAFFLTRSKFQNWDRVILFSGLGIMLFYYFWSFQNLVFGPRYYYILTLLLLMMIARAAYRDVPEQGVIAPSIIMALIVITLISALPVRLWHFVSAFRPSRFQAAALKNEMIRMGNTKTLVFLEQISPEYVDWNDPFLRGPVILCRDLEQKNQEAIQAFSEFRPMYFRLSLSSGKGGLGGGYRLEDKRSERPPGYLSLFELALSLQTQQRNPDLDLFDVCYDGFFTSRNAAAQLEYLSKKAEPQIKEDEYRKNFRLAVIHVARFLLLPKLALEENGDHWIEHCSPEEIRNEFVLTERFARASGEVGKAILVELDKVRRRIDQNNDGVMKDEEVFRFLSKKMRNLRIQ